MSVRNCLLFMTHAETANIIIYTFMTYTDIVHVVRHCQELLTFYDPRRRRPPSATLPVSPRPSQSRPTRRSARSGFVAKPERALPFRSARSGFGPKPERALRRLAGVAGRGAFLTPRPRNCVHFMTTTKLSTFYDTHKIVYVL